MKNLAIISSGSNIDPIENTERAAELLASLHMLKAKSTFAFTRPVGYANQPDFYNGAFLVETLADQETFVASLKDIESRLNRERTENKAGPRTIDLDLIFWNKNCVHADYPAVDYVRIPVNELLSLKDDSTKN